MPRTPLSPAQRAANVASAATALDGLTQAAIVALTVHGALDTRTLRAWEHVEVQGAIVHRQARLLAGKSKGG